MLKKSLEELIKVNAELTNSIEEFNNMNVFQGNNDDKSSREKGGQNVDDMQNKIDMLTMEVEMLRAEVGGGQNQNGNYQNQGNSNSGQDN